MTLARLILLVFAPLFAQDEDLPPDEIADLVDLYVERGEESLRIGSYVEAQLRFEKVLARDPENRAAFLGIVSALTASVTAVFYLDTRVRHEALDLEVRLARLVEEGPA